MSQPITPAAPATPNINVQEPKLPPQLAGAKPRYNIRDRAFTPKFDSDVDRALFITAQKTPSRQDAAYRTWLLKQGYSNSEISNLGPQIKAKIKNIAGTAEEGDISIPRIAPAPNTQPSPAGELNAPPVAPATPMAGHLQALEQAKAGQPTPQELDA